MSDTVSSPTGPSNEELDRLARAAIEVVAAFRSLAAVQEALDDHADHPSRLRLFSLLVGLLVNAALGREFTVAAVAHTLRTLPPDLRRVLRLERGGHLVSPAQVRCCWTRFIRLAHVLAPTALAPGVTDAQAMAWVTARLLEGRRLPGNVF